MKLVNLRTLGMNYGLGRLISFARVYCMSWQFLKFVSRARKTKYKLSMYTVTGKKTWAIKMVGNV